MATCHKTAWELMCKGLLTDHSVTSKEKVEETLNEQSSQPPPPTTWCSLCPGRQALSPLSPHHECSHCKVCPHVPQPH